MTERNVSLLVASYGDDASAAAADFQMIKGLGDTAVVAAVVMDCDSAGKVEVREHGGGLVGGGTAVGAVGGLVVGLFAPPLLWGDYDAVVKAVNEGDEKIIDAAES